MDDMNEDTSAASMMQESDSATLSQTQGDPSDDSERYRLWRGRLAQSRRHIRDLATDWQDNIDYRRGKPFDESSDWDRVQVPADWSLTKAKQAQLFSQVPQVRLKPKNDKMRRAADMWASKLNTQLGVSDVGVAMDEVLPDCINASGYGMAFVYYEALTESREVPAVPPEMVKLYQRNGQEVPTTTQDVPTDVRFCIERVSPVDGRMPVSFTGSDFDRAPWTGRAGRKPWEEALRQWGASESNPNGIREEEKKKLCGDSRTSQDKLTQQTDKNEQGSDEDVVEYEEI